MNRNERCGMQIIFLGRVKMISVGIDVAKGKSKVCIMKPGGELLLPPKDFLHTKHELSQLLEIINSYDEEIKVVLESTGQYHIQVVKFLLENNVFVSVINALRMNKFMSQDIRKVKTDRIDSIQIAMYGITYWSELKPANPINDTYSELRTLSRQYDKTLNLIISAKFNFTHIINSVMPGIDNIFVRKFKSDKLVDFVHDYIHFDNITRQSEKQFVNSLMKWKKKKGYLISETTAKNIYALAKDGIPVLPFTQSTTIIVQEATKTIHELNATRDIILAQMQEFAKTLPEYSVINSMPSLGEILTARVIAEIGDIRKYKNKHSLIAFAGIDAPPYQSGSFNAKECHISKRGNAYLRKIGYEIMQSYIMHKPIGDPVYDFYLKKKLEGKSGKTAMIAGLNKFLRIYYGKVSAIYNN